MPDYQNLNWRNVHHFVCDFVGDFLKTDASMVSVGLDELSATIHHNCARTGTETNPIRIRGKTLYVSMYQPSSLLLIPSHWCDSRTPPVNNLTPAQNVS